MLDTIKGIVYNQNREKECNYVAAGVNIVRLPENREEDEFCIFSQEVNHFLNVFLLFLKLFEKKTQRNFSFFLFS